MFDNLKKWLNNAQKIDLAKQILESGDTRRGLNSENRQKLYAFLELTREVGYSGESRASSNSLSSIIGHLDDRPLIVTRNLISSFMKECDNDDRS